MEYEYIKGLESIEVPNKEELIYILKKHDLSYREDMSKEELWGILVKYFNARDEIIMIARNEDKDNRRLELLKFIDRLKNQ